MKLITATLTLLSLATGVVSHPERLTAKNFEIQKREVGAATNACASQIEARKAQMMEKQAERLLQRRIASGRSDLNWKTESMSLKRNELKYTDIQNDTCVLAPETVWGPYA
jgi:hypothetical protein